MRRALDAEDTRRPRHLDPEEHRAGRRKGRGIAAQAPRGAENIDDVQSGGQFAWKWREAKRRPPRERARVVRPARPDRVVGAMGRRRRRCEGRGDSDPAPRHPRARWPRLRRIREMIAPHRPMPRSEDVFYGRTSDALSSATLRRHPVDGQRPAFRSRYPPAEFKKACRQRRRDERAGAVLVTRLLSLKRLRSHPMPRRRRGPHSRYHESALQPSRQQAMTADGACCRCVPQPRTLVARMIPRSRTARRKRTSNCGDMTSGGVG